MSAKLKVDQLETVDGTGNITVNNQLTGLTSASMPTGSVLQVKSFILTGAISTTYNSFTDIFSAEITPIKSDSRLMITGVIQGQANQSNGVHQGMQINWDVLDNGVSVDSEVLNKYHGHWGCYNNYGLFTSVHRSYDVSSTNVHTIKISGNSIQSGTISYLANRNSETSHLTITEIAG